ncbi:cell division protein FtsQ/DivIB [Nocardioides speluncae]|uniref:cell division protein FtsQ/DivIB n=1 Tax=Nocardioides speluncae TaxID=2670337 RepID=UPI000D699701|nr:FtsQ-type POTRA domain-containing protein [Nocardioides speluncae]
MSTTEPAPSQQATDDDTIAIARKRFVRRQWARRWLAWRRIGLVVLLPLLVCVSVWLVFFSDTLAVSGVEVEGTQVLTPAEVRSAANVKTGEPLAQVDLGAIERRVEGMAAVRSADVSRSWPDKVLIRVEERQAVAVVEMAGRFRGLDEDGVVFRDFAKAPKTLPLIKSDSDTRREALSEAAHVVGALPPEIARKVDFVEVRTVDQITLSMQGGDEVQWGSADDSAQKADVLAVLLKEPASVYDVRVPSRPTTRD